MAGEGGRFFNAMSKGAETLQGKVSNLKGTWKEFQATWAESSGIGTLWKEVIDGLTASIRAQTDELVKNKNAREARENIDAGNGSADDYLIDYEHKIRLIQNQIDQYRSRMYSTLGFLNEKNDMVIAGYQEQIALLEKMKNPYAELIEQDKARIALLEKQRQVATHIQETQSDVLSLAKKRLENTPEQQIKTLMEERVKYENLLKEYRDGVLMLSNTTSVDYSQGGRREYGTESMRKVYGTEEKIQTITKALANLDKEIDKSSKTVEDWQILLKTTLDVTEQAAMTGITAVDEYTTDLYSRLEGSLAFAAVVGRDASDVYSDFADEVERATEALMKSGQFSLDDNSIRGLISLLRELKSNGRYERNGLQRDFAEIMLDLRRNISNQGLWETNDSGGIITGLVKNYQNVNRSWTDIRKDELRSKYGFDESRLNTITNYEKIENTGDMIGSLNKQLDLLKMSREERERQLLIDQGIHESYVDQVLALQKQVDAAQLLNEVMKDLGEAMLTQGISGLIDMAHELGQAFQDGAISADEMSDAFKNYIKNMINALPSMLLQAGLQLLIAGQWPVGLALIGASGLMAFVSGLIDTPENRSSDDVNKLQHIADQITSLLESQRKNEEYYFQKRRELNAGWAAETVAVNDMILTPHGNFSTSPDDYIIATKNPSTLGGGTVVNITVHNEAGDVASATATQTTGPDGMEIAIMVRKLVANDIATGKLDGALNAQQARNNGKRVTG
jgi:hypothetical protein